MPNPRSGLSIGRPIAYDDQSVYICAMTPQSPLLAPRGRPREFDTDVAVERAMEVFWTSGYHGTSLPDLLQATRLSRGSLYAAFGDKHGLFLRALDRYIEEALARLDAELDRRESALAGLRSCVAGYVERERRPYAALPARGTACRRQDRSEPGCITGRRRYAARQLREVDDRMRRPLFMHVEL
jgi:AcrR family transcriptional regulator